MLGIESLEKVFELAFKSLTMNFWISLACVIWVSAAFRRDTESFSVLVSPTFCAFVAERRSLYV